MPQHSLSRILHVDDEPHICEIVGLALRLIGRFTVESCSSGQQAIARAAEFRPDMILLDVMMPEMNGPETLIGLRALDVSAGVPIVFMTARTEMPDRDRLCALGAVDVIAKPFDPLLVSEQIAAIWERHARQ